MKSTISIQRCNDYKMGLLKEALSNIFQPFGGFQAIIHRGDQVLVKPNLLKPSLPNTAVTTHPALIQALLEICLDMGAKPFVGDSPGFFSLKRVSEVTGLKKIADKLGIKVHEFKNPVSIPSIHGGRTLHRFKLDRRVLDADCIVNVPKLKAHQQVVLTGAIKNLYGSIPGKRKAKYHYQFGERENLFGEMLLENYQLIKPTFTVVDGILAMEGNGPAHGKPRTLGLLLGGKDGIAIDRVLCEILQIDPRKVITLQAAMELNVGAYDMDQINVVGEALKNLIVSDFLMAQPMPIKFEFTRVVRSVLRNLYYRYLKGPLQ